METTTMSNHFPPANQIFDDLDQYRDWCRYEGKKFNEADLYKNDSYLWQQYLRYQHYMKNKGKKQ